MEINHLKYVNYNVIAPITKQRHKLDINLSINK